MVPVTDAVVLCGVLTQILQTSVGVGCVRGGGGGCVRCGGEGKACEYTNSRGNIIMYVYTAYISLVTYVYAELILETLSS